MFKLNYAHLVEVDKALGGLLVRATADEEFTGKEAQQLSMHTHGKLPAARLLVLGLGKKRDADKDRDALRVAAARALRAAKAAGAKTLAIAWPAAEVEAELAREVQALAEGAA